MNFFIHLTIIMLFPLAFAKMLPDTNQIESDSEENDDDSEAIHETHHRNMKHTVKDSRIKKHQRDSRSVDKPTFAIMYKNEEPVGILERNQDSYLLLPVHSDDSIDVEVHNIEGGLEKRETSDEDGQLGEEVSHFSDEKYPYIFAKFKIDSRVEKEGQKSRSLAKRSSKHRKALRNEKQHADSLNSALSKIESNGEGAEAELKGILNDMGLIDENVANVEKRDAEDEDMERGTNKIELVQAGSTERVYKMLSIPEKIDEDKMIDEYIQKHPEKFKDNQNNREKRSEDVSVAMQQEIQKRLRKIKDEVRNEIEKLKSNEDQAEEEEDEDDEDEEEVNNPHRKKRDINTLEEEETSDLDPVLVADSSLVPHIRRRRNAFSLRKLQEYTDMNEREKKACKCSGKGCKCGHPKATGQNLRDGRYSLDTDPEVYQIKGNADFKRNGFFNLMAVHGRSDIVDQLVTIRKRSMVPKIRAKRTADREKLTLEDMSDIDLFGALPQGFEGELSRVKRIK